MNPKFPFGRTQFGSDVRGATPVISTVLVVALTVIVAALVGTNAIGTANHSATTGPSIGFHTHWEGTDTLVIEHQSGEAVETARITIVVDGEEVYDGGTPGADVTITGWDGEKVSAGDTIEITSTSASGFAGEEFAVYYEWDGKSFVLVED